MICLLRLSAQLSLAGISVQLINCAENQPAIFTAELLSAAYQHNFTHIYCRIPVVTIALEDGICASITVLVPAAGDWVSSCAGCGGLIQDQFILRVSPDLSWHAACLKVTRLVAMLVV